MNNQILFSSRNQQWATRTQDFLNIQEALGRKYNLDPCAEVETAKCPIYITKEEDTFNTGWFSKTHGSAIQYFANPPYGRMMPKFVEYFMEQSKKDGIVGDVLIPARTDTKMFHDIILPNASKISFIKGRLTFGTDEYWQWIWEQPTMIEINGTNKVNTLYGKQGKMNPAPFPSMVVSFCGDGTGLEFGTLDFKEKR